jgi:hypothetical protein
MEKRVTRKLCETRDGRVVLEGCDITFRYFPQTCVLEDSFAM